MLLQRLKEYEERESGGAVPLDYNLKPVKYWIELDADGGLLGMVAAEDAEGGRPKLVPIPAVQRASSVKPNLLVDNAPYVLGVEREGDKPARVRQMHDAFVAQARACAGETQEPPVGAVVRFLESNGPTSLTLPPDFDPKQTIGFLVDGARPTDLPAVQDWWARHGAEGRLLECLVCGRERPAMDRLTLKLKGIPGGQASGLALISANAPAFESYGLDASQVAPVCQECSDKFMKGGAALLGGENTHLRVGDSVYVFWTRASTGPDVLRLLSSPGPDQVRELLTSIWRGHPASLDPAPFYACALSASGGRAVVRDYVESTVGRVREQLARFFALQQIVGPWGEEPEWRGVFALVRAAMRTGTTDSPRPWLASPLVHCALAGGPLPWTLLSQAVERCRAEQGVSPARAALIKMVLASHPQVEGVGDMTELNGSDSSPSYLCGRLFAELEQVQHAALGNTGASIVDRFYGTASSAPATVFGRLLRGAQPHLAKLERDRPGAYHALDRRLQEIMMHLPTFPTTLTLEQQGIFALGYYHQRASDRRAALEHRGPGKPAAESEEE